MKDKKKEQEIKEQLLFNELLWETHYIETELEKFKKYQVCRNYEQQLIDTEIFKEMQI